MDSGDIPDSGRVYNPRIEEIHQLCRTYVAAYAEQGWSRKRADRLYDDLTGIVTSLRREDPAAAIVACSVAAAGIEQLIEHRGYPTGWFSSQAAQVLERLRRIQRGLPVW